MLFSERYGVKSLNDSDDIDEYDESVLPGVK
jgi:hypothetical protein